MNTCIEFKMTLLFWGGSKPAVQNYVFTDDHILLALKLDILITLELLTEYTKESAVNTQNALQ